MSNFGETLFAALLSGSVLSAILGALFYGRTKRLEAQIRDQFERSLAEFKSQRDWKEKSISELLGPLNMQFERTNRAFRRWRNKNLYLESKIIREGNITIRDLLLRRGHLIPPELLEDAGKLIEHYDRWLEKFERVRIEEQPEQDEAFVFVGPEGYPFPSKSEERFREKFKEMWGELYSTTT